MNRNIATQSIFNETPAPPSWRSYLTSGVVHTIFIGALFVITFPALKAIKPVPQRAVLIAPVVPEYKPKIIPPAQRILPQPVFVRTEVKPKALPVIKPPVIKPVQVKPQVIASAPEVKNLSPMVRTLPEPKIEAPAPKPEIHTGTFETAEAPKGPPAPKMLEVGGFGDPNGVPATADPRPSNLTMAKVGSFDLPNGGGKTGGSGQSSNSVVHQGSFGSLGEGSASGNNSGHTGSVRTGGFGDSSVAAPADAPRRPVVPQPATTPVEIISKPKPAYTQEARNLKLEGQVSLEVVFLSNGSIRILRVVRGLGHGLDEAAKDAALQVRFKPATRGGVPIDTNATINITFELT